MKTSCTLKPLSNTRWSCRADSTKALRENYSAIREALGRLAADAEEKNGAKLEAAVLCLKLDKLEISIMSNLRDTVMSQVKSSHLYLYSAFNNTNCNKALHNIKIGKFVNNVK